MRTQEFKGIYEKIPLYKNILNGKRFPDEFRQLPIVGKNHMINNQGGCIAPEYCAKYLGDELLRRHTSGSTGKYLDVFWDRADYNRSMMEIWMKRYKYYGVFPHNRFCYFYTEADTNEMYLRYKNELGICKNLLNPEKIDEAYEILLEWNPEWMLVQPSTMVILCNYIKHKHKVVPSELRYIEFTGELLTEEIINMTKDVFHCLTANQYGANEVNAIAYTCRNGNMHIMRSNVFVEIVDDEDNVICDSSDGIEGSDDTGRVVLTSLTNNAMPFIRYDIGDYGRILKNACCDCGCKGKLFVLQSGRNNDYVMFDDGSRISSYVFVRILDKVNNLTDGAVIQFYIEQRAYDMFYVKLYADDEILPEYIVDLFIRCIDDPHLAKSKYEFEFEFADNIFDEEGKAKYIYFKNKIKY